MNITDILSKLHIIILRNDNPNKDDNIHNFTVKIEPSGDFVAIPVISKYVLKNTNEENALNIMDFSTSIRNVKNNTEILLEKYNTAGKLNIENKYTCVNKNGDEDIIYYLHLCILDKKKINSFKITSSKEHELLLIYFKSIRKKEITENNIRRNVLLRKIAFRTNYTYSTKKKWKIKERGKVVETEDEYEKPVGDEEEEEIVIPDQFNNGEEIIHNNEKLKNIEKPKIVNKSKTPYVKEKINVKCNSEHNNEKTTNEKRTNEKDTKEDKTTIKTSSKAKKFIIAFLVPLFLIILMIGGIVGYKYYKMKREEHKTFFELDMDYEMIEV